MIDEYRHEDDLLLGDRTAYPGLTENVHLLHFQGVYTWDRSVRLTYKIPYVLDARRELPDGFGGKRVEHDNGIVEDFDWVSKLSDEAIESSIKTVREAHPEEATDIAFMVYFAYLEMPEFEKWFKPEDVFKAHFEAAGAGAKGD